MEPQARLHLLGDSNSAQPVILSKVMYNNLADIPALQGISTETNGWGYGGLLSGGYMGLRASADAGAWDNWAYGVYGEAHGTTGTRIGVYGYAAGGDENWAGYFDGKGKFMDHLSLEKSLHALDYLSTDRNLFVKDTTFTSNIHTRFGNPWMEMKTERDLTLTINSTNNPSFTSVFRIKNGAAGDIFAADENGNARTYGTQYIDGALYTGPFSGSPPAIGVGNIVAIGPDGFNANGERGIVYLGGVHHYIAAEYGYGVRIGTYNYGDALSIQESTGSVLIGKPANVTQYAQFKLNVDGRIIAEELKIKDSGNWPDYVFDADYDLLPLNALEQEIKSSGHLPGIPSAKEVEENGIFIGDMQKRTIEKIEELTLYILELHKEVEKLREQNILLEKKLSNL